MKKTITLVIGIMMLCLFTFGEMTEAEPLEAKYYENAKVIRVKYSQGETFVKRSYDEGLEEATENLPLFESDRVGTTEGLIELYLGRLNYLRLDNDTEIEFDKAPALRKTDMVIRMERGGIYLDIDSLDNEKDIEVQTPDCGVFVLDKGLYRINVTEEGRTEVLVFKGRTEVAGDDFSRVLKADQKVVMGEGRVLERPYYHNAAEKDDFDDWNESRASELGYARYGSTNNYMEQGYEDYEYELSRNGRWRYNNTYNSYTWIPYNVGGDWSPYYNGRWVWHPFYGYVWHSYDSWGWFTHHYGRWHWSYYDGWCWLPGYRWSPAWVSWYGNGPYYAWSPLSRYNRPIIVIKKRWLKNYNFRNGMPINSRSLVVVKKNQLSSANIRKVALRGNKLDNISNKTIAFRGNAPNDRFKLSKVNVINAKGRNVVYKQNGMVSRDRYRKVSSTGAVVTKSGANPVYKYNSSGVRKSNPDKYSTRVVKKDSGYTPGLSGDYSYKKSNRSKTYKKSGSGSSYGSKSSSSKKVYKKSSGSSSSSVKRSNTTTRKSSSSSSSTSRKIKKKKKESYPSLSSNSSYSSSYSSPGTSTSSRSRKTYTSKRPISKSYKSYKSSYSSYSSPGRSYSSSGNSGYSSSPIKYKSSSYKTSKRSYSGSSYSKSSTRSSSSSSRSRSVVRSSSSRSSSRSSSSSSSSRSIKKK